MPPVDSLIRSHGGFLRRRDLLALGVTDGLIRSALTQRRIFRVRHGWYSLPGANERAVQAVRVGGRLTSPSALESYGLPVPRNPRLHVAVPPTANRLRRPMDRRRRISRGDSVTVHWTDRRTGSSRWRVTIADALLAVLASETREIAIAACSAALHHRRITARALDDVFARAPARVRRWRGLVSALDESHGETFYRIRAIESGRPCEQQVIIPGIGRFDFRVSEHVYVEVDGGQHDPAWSGGTASSWANDLRRDLEMAVRGDRVIHIGYPQLYGDWTTILEALDRVIADDAALVARRRRHPYRPRTQQKRRRSAPNPPP